MPSLADELAKAGIEALDEIYYVRELYACRATKEDPKKWWDNVVSVARAVQSARSPAPAADPSDHPIIQSPWDNHPNLWIISAAVLMEDAFMVKHTPRLNLRKTVLQCIAGKTRLHDTALVCGLALAFACQNGDLQLLQFMILEQDIDGLCVLPLNVMKENLDRYTYEGDTALMIACQNGHDKCALALIENGADVNAIYVEEDPWEEEATVYFTALMYACMKGHDKCALTLIDAGADVNYEGNHTALMYACMDGHDKCAVALIQAGADVDCENPNAYTALMFACTTIERTTSGHMKCVRALLDAGADVVAPVGSWGSAFSSAWHYGSKPNEPLVKLLMAHMAHTHELNWCGDDIERVEDESFREWLRKASKWPTPLHFVDVSSPDRTRALLRQGADILSASEDGTTPLDLARQAEGESANLIQKASEPWSAETHDLFPLPARRRARDLVMLGYLLSDARFEGAEVAFRDVWRCHVMPFAVSR